MPRINVLPRDIQPGDKIDRLDKDINIVQATVREVKKVRPYEHHTAYRVFFVEYDELPDNRRSWTEYSHLRPPVFQPRQKVTVERETS